MLSYCDFFKFFSFFNVLLCGCVLCVQLYYQVFDVWFECECWYVGQCVYQQYGVEQQYDEQWFVGWQCVVCYCDVFFCGEGIGDCQYWYDCVEVVELYCDCGYLVVEWCVDCQVCECVVVVVCG